MKGAIAEPLVRTMRPPKIAIMTKMGTSQYFFRTRRNNENSRRKDSMCSNLVLHGFGRRPGAHDPIACGLGVAAQSQRVFAQGAHQQRDRRHRRVSPSTSGLTTR